MQDFSVLMSVYAKEQPEWLRLAMESVFNQTVKPTEVVLVEDGPLTDELERVVLEFEAAHKELKVVRSPQNQGLGRALNLGLQHCTYDLVARMDTDDICKPYRFERQLSVFEEMTDVDVCSAWIDEFSETPEHVVSQRLVPETPEENYRYAKTRCPVNHPVVFYRKNKVLEQGGYHGFPEDYYLWVKMLQAGCRFYNVQESLLWMRFNSDLIKRRGGWKYAKDDLRAQWNFYKVGFLSFTELMKNTSIRLVVRLMPNKVRGWIYKGFLRKRASK